MKSRVSSILALGFVVAVNPAIAVQIVPPPTVGVTASGHSLQPVITPNGSHIVFLSQANNLVTNDNVSPFLDIFARDRLAGVTTLLSVSRTGFGGGNGDSSHPAISSDGNFVLFASDADNLVANDTNRATDVFLYDRSAGVIHLISVNRFGRSSSTFNTGSPFKGSSQPVMTPDARWVVFESTASDLVLGDTNNGPDLFLRDVSRATTRLITVGANNRRSYSPSITPDASKIAFVSTALNLPTGQTVSNPHVYVYSTASSNRVWASSNLPPLFGGFLCANPVIAPNGNSVAFKVVPVDTTIPARIYHHDLFSGATTLVATNTRPDTKVAFTSASLSFVFENNDNVYLHNTVTRSNTLVSVNASETGPAGGVSLRPVITPDGRQVAFVSSATNLIDEALPGGTNLFRLYVRDLPLNLTRLVNRSTNGSPSTSDAEGVLISLSDDGRLVAFDSDAPDLVSQDYNAANDVFLSDLSANSTLAVSERHPARPPATGVQAASLTRWSLSADAQRIAFTSYDDPRVPGDTNDMIDAFVHDVQTGAIIPQSTSNGAFAPLVNGVSPMISPSGEHLLFVRDQRPYSGQSFVDLIWRRVDGSHQLQVITSFIPSGKEWDATLNSNGTLIVYFSHDQLWLTDMLAQTNRLLYTGFGLSRPQFGPDEQWVTFFSDSTIRAAYVPSNRIVVVSRDQFGNALPASSGTFDRTGRYFAFDRLGQRAVYRYDFHADTSQLIATNFTQPSLSADGNFGAAVGILPVNSDIYLFDISSNTRKLLTRSYNGGPAAGPSSSPLISPNARYVVFLSHASNLVLNDTNRAQDVFVYDGLQNTTVLVTRNVEGFSGNALSSLPIIARDGRTIVFQSFAGDLVSGDYNERRDIFMLHLGAGDSDNDGLDDDWEVTYFSNLGRDGSGDFDGDGHTDLREFLAGSNPTNDQSILRVLTLTSVTGVGDTVVWSAVPGQSYVVQFNSSLHSSEWTSASGPLRATSNSESFTFSSTLPTRRFYRVVAVR